MDIIRELADNFKHYISIDAVHPTATYNYAKRGFFNLPVVKCQRLLPKCTEGESWTYIAVPAGSKLYNLADDERLYVGAQTQDRMFRGDGLGGDNFHHAEMRAGRGSDNLITYLRAGNRVEIHRVASSDALRAIDRSPRMSQLAWIADAEVSKKKHVGYWLEQAILVTQPGKWRWNSAPAVRAAKQHCLDRAQTRSPAIVSGLTSRFSP